MDEWSCNTEGPDDDEVVFTRLCEKSHSKIAKFRHYRIEVRISTEWVDEKTAWFLGTLTPRSSRTAAPLAAVKLSLKYRLPMSEYFCDEDGDSIREVTIQFLTYFTQRFRGTAKVSLKFEGISSMIESKKEVKRMCAVAQNWLLSEDELLLSITNSWCTHFSYDCSEALARGINNTIWSTRGPYWPDIPKHGRSALHFRK